MREIIAGVGITRFGSFPESLSALGVAAATEALRDARMSVEQIDALYVGNMLSDELQGQAQLGALFTSELGMTCLGMKAEGACASGSLAVHAAIQALKAKTYETVLVIGVEKMTGYPVDTVERALMKAASEEERAVPSNTFPVLYAKMARAHMDTYGTTREQLMQVAIKNHHNACFNDKAQFRKEITMEQVLRSAFIPNAKPFTKYDTCPFTDGAAALVLTTKESGRKNQVYISASAAATNFLGLAERASITELAATKKAGQLALAQSGLTIDDIDVGEVHDCFTIAEILAMEDLGFCKKGEGGPYVASGATSLGGEVPINTSGGLKACGHPVGATGVKQIVEIYDQLQGRAGPRQVKNARIGLTHNVGGTGATAVVHILQRT